MNTLYFYLSFTFFFFFFFLSFKIQYITLIYWSLNEACWTKQKKKIINENVKYACNIFSFSNKGENKNKILILFPIVVKKITKNVQIWETEVPLFEIILHSSSQFISISRPFPVIPIEIFLFPSDSVKTLLSSMPPQIYPTVLSYQRIRTYLSFASVYSSYTGSILSFRVVSFQPWLEPFSDNRHRRITSLASDHNTVDRLRTCYTKHDALITEKLLAYDLFPRRVDFRLVSEKITLLRMAILWLAFLKCVPGRTMCAEFNATSQFFALSNWNREKYRVECTLREEIL